MNAMNMPGLKLSTMLSQVATIVTVSKTSLGLKRQDKSAARQADMQHGAKIGASTTSVNRFVGSGAERVKEVNAIADELIAEIKARSTDWNGQRLVNNTILQEVLGIYHQKKALYNAKVQALVDDAPALIAEAHGGIGDFKVVPPSEDEIRDAFSLSFEVSQIADTDKFKATGVDASLEAEMKRRFEDGVQAAFNNAQRDALQRVAKPVAHLIERMTAYDKSIGPDGKGGRLYDSTVTNITDIGKVFRSFNVLNDPFLDGLAKQLDAFENIDADDLKKDKQLRADVSAKAAAILDSLKDLI
jgi:hypothetical protein